MYVHAIGSAWEDLEEGADGRAAAAGQDTSTVAALFREIDTDASGQLDREEVRCPEIY
jgi:hypothetical protein